MLIGREQLGEFDATLAGHAESGRAGVLLVHLRGIRQLIALLGFDAGAALMDASAERLAQALRPIDRMWRIAPDEFRNC